MSHPFVVILLGPPGVGKGTQATKIHQKLNLPHISTGDILRANIKAQTPLGLQTQNIIAKGELVPDNLVDTMLMQRLEQKDCRKGFILDGYPRTLSQAHTLENLLDPKASLHIFLYEAKEATIVTRISGRLVCKNCGQVFHKTFKPPKVHNLCDGCSQELSQRKDDQEDVVLERLKIYKKTIDPVVQFYKQKHLLHTISCEGTIEDAFSQTLHYLHKAPL
ncbi:MAG: adenylate kinase [Chlamydiae bacterium]|nr:adenylate kinase [Chlamydiota bacterium]